MSDPNESVGERRFPSRSPGGAGGAELSRLAARLDALTTWLFWIAATVFVLGLVAGAIILTTKVDTLGLVTPQVEGHSRVAIAAAVAGILFAGAGTVAGLAGILRALVRGRWP